MTTTLQCPACGEEITKDLPNGQTHGQCPECGESIIIDASNGEATDARIHP